MSSNRRCSSPPPLPSRVITGSRSWAPDHGRITRSWNQEVTGRRQRIQKRTRLRTNSYIACDGHLTANTTAKFPDGFPNRLRFGTIANGLNTVAHRASTGNLRRMAVDVGSRS